MHFSGNVCRSGGLQLDCTIHFDQCRRAFVHISFSFGGVFQLRYQYRQGRIQDFVKKKKKKKKKKKGGGGGYF